MRSGQDRVSFNHRSNSPRISQGEAQARELGTWVAACKGSWSVESRLLLLQGHPGCGSQEPSTGLLSIQPPQGKNMVDSTLSFQKI